MLSMLTNVNVCVFVSETVIFNLLHRRKCWKKCKRKGGGKNGKLWKHRKINKVFLYKKWIHNLPGLEKIKLVLVIKSTKVDKKKTAKLSNYWKKCLTNVTIKKKKNSTFHCFISSSSISTQNINPCVQRWDSRVLWKVIWIENCLIKISNT